MIVENKHKSDIARIQSSVSPIIRESAMNDKLGRLLQILSLVTGVRDDASILSVLELYLGGHSGAVEIKGISRDIGWRNDLYAVICNHLGIEVSEEATDRLWLDNEEILTAGQKKDSDTTEMF